MIRVHFEDGEPIDIEANQSVVGPAGELILNECELGEVVNPQTFQKVTTIVAQTWKRTFGPRSHWTWAEPVTDDESVVPARRLEALQA